MFFRLTRASTLMVMVESAGAITGLEQWSKPRRPNAEQIIALLVPSVREIRAIITLSSGERAVRSRNSRDAVDRAS